MSLQELEGLLAKISPDLARAAGHLRSEIPAVFRASYRYGELIVDHGRFCAPCNSDSCVPCRELLEESKYSCIPLSAVLSKSVEVFIDPQHSGGWDPENPRHVPLRLLGEGEFFGVFEVLDRMLGTPSMSPVWSISAGARSIWIVAPIGDDRISQWLRREKGIRWSDDTHQHWQLVRSLHGADWSCDVLVFPRKMMDSLRSAPQLYELLLELGWKYSAGLRNASSTEAAIRSNFQNSYSKTPQGELQHFATVRHLLDVASGSAPGFQPAVSSKVEAGPFQRVCATIEKCLAMVRKDYQPLILQPAHLENSGEMGFYSFRCPSVPGPRPAKVPNYAEIPGTISDALEVFRDDPNVALDYAETTFFARSGPFAKPVKNILPDPAAKVYFNSPFFVAGARIVRAESHRQKTHGAHA